MKVSTANFIWPKRTNESGTQTKSGLGKAFDLTGSSKVLPLDNCPLYKCPPSPLVPSPAFIEALKRCKHVETSISYFKSFHTFYTKLYIWKEKKRRQREILNFSLFKALQ